MNFTRAGVDLLKECEGCKLDAYPDPATGGAPWTIGYGCTRGVYEGMKISQAQAEELLLSELELVKARVRAEVHPSLTDNQYSAAVCFAYNVKNWKTTPLFALLRDGKCAEAAGHWELYCKANGKEMGGLKIRREKELALFMAL